MALKARSFIPPTEVEYDPATSQNYTIVWSLGNKSHPWKNIYLKDFSQEGSVVTDVYASLQLIANIPFDERQSGTLLYVDNTPQKRIQWIKLDDLAKDANYGLKANTIVADVLKQTPVNRAVADKNGIDIDLYYTRTTDFVDKKIVEKLNRLNYPVKRTDTSLPVNVVPYAEADQNGKIIDTTYVNYTTGDTRYCPMSHKPLKDRQPEDPEGALDPTLTVAFTNDYRSLYNQPSIPSYDELVEVTYALVETTLTGDKESVWAMPGGGLHEPRIRQLRIDLDNLTKNVNDNAVFRTYYANRTENGVVQPGILKVTTGNGLKLDIDETNKISTLRTEKARYNNSTDYELGTVYITPGNGLNYANGTGQVSMSTASTTGLGTVKLGVISSYSGSITSVPTDGQWYTWTGIPTGSGLTSQKWLVKKLLWGTGKQVFICACSTEDPALELHSVNNGDSWSAPYAHWYEK